MKPNDPLNLQAWKVEVTPPANFESEVWQRIAARAPERRTSSFGLSLSGWFDSLIAQLLRPAWATALVAFSIGSGLGLSQLAAAQARSGAFQELQSRYVQSINPLASHADSLE